MAACCSWLAAYPEKTLLRWHGGTPGAFKSPSKLLFTYSSWPHFELGDQSPPHWQGTLLGENPFCFFLLPGDVNSLLNPMTNLWIRYEQWQWMMDDKILLSVGQFNVKPLHKVGWHAAAPGLRYSKKENVIFIALDSYSNNSYKTHFFCFSEKKVQVPFISKKYWQVCLAENKSVKVICSFLTRRMPPKVFCCRGIILLFFSG